MIERDGKLSVTRQAQLLELSRASVYYRHRGASEPDLALMRRLDELHLRWPFYGSRRLAHERGLQGHARKPHTSILARDMVASRFLSE